MSRIRYSVQPLPEPTAGAIVGGGGTFSFAGAAVAAYHGYRRASAGERVPAALLWGFFGFLLPMPAVGVAVIQGYGKR